MNRLTILGICAVLAFAAAGCSDDGQKQVPAIHELNEIGYGTRAGGTPPADGTSYTFISYNEDPENGGFYPYTLTSEDENAATYHQKPVGYYAYMSDAQYKGILQPALLDDRVGTATSIPYGIISRKALNGQALYNGTFRTVCLQPGIGIVRNGDFERGLFSLDQEAYATEPFDIKVDGYEIFELDVEGEGPRQLIDLRSKVVMDFVQGGSETFTISAPVQINAGVWGWYHPLLQDNMISYDAADPGNIYDFRTNPTAGNERALTMSNNYGSVAGDIYSTGATGVNSVVYTTGKAFSDGVFFFPNNYLESKVLQPSIAFTLHRNGSSYDVVIPLNIEMKRGVCYNFRLIFTSASVKVTFRVAPWQLGQDENEDIGSESQILGIWTVRGWLPGNTSGSEDIGD